MKNSNSLERLIRLLMIVLFLGVAACSEEDPEPVGNPPNADAGPDLQATVGSSVTLDGTGSSDPDGGTLTYAWVLTSAPAGSSAAITGATQASATFTPDVAGPYQFTLTVTDPDGNSDNDTATITAEEAAGEPPVVFIVDENGRPISEDNENNTVTVGTPYALDGSNSIDPDTEADDLTFTWEIVESPDGSSDAEVTSTADDPDEANFIPDVVGEYTIRLTVEDPEGNIATAEVTIEADANPVTIDSNITEATTWPNVFDNPDLPDYYVVADVRVEAALTVAPGVKVMFEPNRGLTITGNSGSLSAIGNADSLIVFTAEDTLNGWDGIVFFNDNAQNEFNYADISYGGQQDFGFGVLASNVGIDGNGGVTISNTTISNSFNYGIFLELGGLLRDLSNSALENNMNNPVALSLSQVGSIDVNTTFSGNQDNTVEIYGSNINLEEELVMPALSNGTFYFVSGRLDVDSGLEIEAGTQVEFDTDAFIEVSGGDGYINAEGTAADSIVLVGRNQADGWGGIVIYTSDSRNSFAYSRVAYGGNRDFGFGVSPANIGVDSNGEVKISNSVIANSVGDHGIFVELNGTIDEFSQNTFLNNNEFPITLPITTAGVLDAASTFTGNGDNSVQIFSSTLTNGSDPQTLPALANDVPYYVSGRLDIDNDLTILPGATFEFNQDVRIEVSGGDGSINAEGTADSVITFTARDQSDGWLGMVFFTNTTANKLIHTDISYGGRGDFGFGVDAANVGVDANGKVAIANSSISNSEAFGIFVENNGELTDGAGTDLTTNQEVVDAENTFSDNTSGDTNLP
ncbi:MAG: PKD domain-containing protein [Cyclobacteriaceae bacterium]